MGDWADWEIEKMEDYYLDPIYNKHYHLIHIEPDEIVEYYLTKETSVSYNSWLLNTKGEEK